MPAEATSWGRRWCAGYRPWSFAGQRQAGLALLSENVCVLPEEVPLPLVACRLREALGLRDSPDRELPSPEASTWVGLLHLRLLMSGRGTQCFKRLLV